MSLKKVAKAFLCSYCTNINVLELRVSCSKEACECGETFEFKTVLDMYANLYFHLDNRNLIDYETLIAENVKRFVTIQKKLENRWEAHKRHSPFLYANRAQWGLKKETYELFRSSLEEAADAAELLITAMGWLLLLDEQLMSLRNDFRTKHIGDVLISTVRGPMLYPCSSPIVEYLSEFPNFRLPVDPNYLILRSKVSNFYLVRESYSHYTVSHRYISLPSLRTGDVGGMKLGFVPGKFRVEHDYRYDIDKEPNDDGLLPFSFRGVKNKRTYEQKVKKLFETILKENPDVLLLPELMTPLPLQEELKKKLSQKAEERLGKERHRTAMMMTGSFHTKAVDIVGNDATPTSKRIYNYGQVTDDRGDTLFGVYKMNRFILAQNADYNGELSPFQAVDGVERNGYDKREIVVGDTPWGRIAVLICVDFINANLGEVLFDRQVDLIFLMTMTPGPASGKFKRRMEELGERNQAVIVACNHLGKDTLEPDEREDRIVVYLPGFKGVFTAKEEAAVYKLSDIAEVLNRSSAKRPATTETN